MAAIKRASGIPTIDVSMVTITAGLDPEFGFDTANKIGVEVQTEEVAAVKLVVKGILRAQKPATSTITGHKITLTDNMFNADLVVLLQGGVVEYDAIETDLVVGYTPPLAGASNVVEPFILAAYSAQYDASGSIVRYEKISYPNCTGMPIAFSSEDGAFRVPEYVINSAPNTGEAPYVITYVATTALPTFMS